MSSTVKPVIVSPFHRRQLSAYTVARRLGGTLARIIDQHLSVVLAAIPAEPTPYSLRGVAELTGRAFASMRVKIPQTLEAGLRTLAARTRFKAAKLLTIAARKANKRKREDDVADMLNALADYENLIIQAPTLSELRRIVGFAPEALTRYFEPQMASDTVLFGISQGWTRQRIIRELTALFDGAKVAARRVARTEGLRVATQTTLAVSETIPELVYGYRINAVDEGHNPTSRPEHRKRHGTIYYRAPKGSQKGLDKMPQPPHEADGELAYNCRCFLEPLITGDTPD